MNFLLNRPSLLAALALSGVWPAFADGAIKIGALAPLSSNAAADGQEMVRGVQMAIDELNAARGVNGYKFDIVVGDTRDQNSDAVTSAFERLATRRCRS